MMKPTFEGRPDGDRCGDVHGVPAGSGQGQVQRGQVQLNPTIFTQPHNFHSAPQLSLSHPKIGFSWFLLKGLVPGDLGLLD